jgi:hypothetical protein
VEAERRALSEKVTANWSRPRRPDWRLMREEAFLAANLAGYSDYRGRVHYRLAPNLW